MSNTKRLHLQDYLSRYNPHVALLQETRLRQCHRPHISGYTLVYLPVSDRVAQSTPQNVGTAVAVKNGIQHSFVHFSLTFGFCTFVEVTDGGRKILIGSFYLHPSTNAVDTESAFTQMEGLTSQWDSVIIGGDFNAHFVVPMNSNGRGLESFLVKSTEFELLSPPTSTFRSGSILDYFLLKDNHDNLPRPVCTTLDRISDHCGIRLRFGGGCPIHLLKEEAQKKLSYGGIDWSQFNELVDLSASNADVWCPDTPEEIDAGVELLTDAVNRQPECFLAFTGRRNLFAKTQD